MNKVIWLKHANVVSLLTNIRYVSFFQLGWLGCFKNFPYYFNNISFILRLENSRYTISEIVVASPRFTLEPIDPQPKHLTTTYIFYK